MSKKWSLEQQETHAEAMRRSWADPEIRARRIAAMNKAQKDPLVKAKAINRANTPEAIARVKQVGHANRGKVHSEEQNQNHGKIMKTKTHTEETKAKMSASHKKHYASFSKEEREAFHLRNQKVKYKPTSIERAVGEILDAEGIAYIRHPWVKVVCDGEKRVLRPDFVLPALNLVVEAQGCYWHGCDPCYGDKGRKDRCAEDKVREMLFQEQGYHVLFLWEHDIKAGRTLEILAQTQIFDER